ncbi:MAG TPA: protein kinase [Planctomycetota bacterium]|nr:protein kinase [Planctomycetota bacterium]
MGSGNLIGKTIAGCRLLSSVARGSMGEVFKGVHEALQRPVAVKLVGVDAQAKDAVDKLLLEARALAKIEHPNIVHVYDVGVQDGLFYIVMQFLEGRTLREVFDEMGAMPPDEVYSIIGDVARGLGAMHLAGLIHRDLKHENVIVTSDGKAKIMDFGLVRDAGAKDEYQGFVVGTPPYIPPEIWLNRPADGRSDLYSLGVMLYALLTGAYPYRAKSPEEYAQLHLKSTPKNPVLVRSEVGEELAAVTMKLLARNRADRYPSVEDFLRDFEGCRRGTAPEALRSTGRRVKCGFCDSVNPAKATKCSVCGEALGNFPKQLDLSPRGGEVACPACGGLRERRARACPHCGRGICGNCLRGVVQRDGLCSACLAIA